MAMLVRHQKTNPCQSLKAKPFVAPMLWMQCYDLTLSLLEESPTRPYFA
jgi:hypothetical protein